MSIIKRRLFFDIETSPNICAVWSAGWKVRVSGQSVLRERQIICISWKWEGNDKVYHAKWDRDKGDQADKKMLETFKKVLEEADEVVGHNVDRFDLPWVRTRAMIHGIILPTDIITYDTLVQARRKFRFNENTLDYIAKLMGLGGKTKTEFTMWLDLLQGTKNLANARLKEMIDYCDEDVRQLEGVFNKLNLFVSHKVHYGVLNGNEKWSCPESSSTNVKLRKYRTTKAGTVKAEMYCEESNRYYSISMREYQNFLKWRNLQKSLI